MLSTGMVMESEMRCPLGLATMATNVNVGVISADTVTEKVTSLLR